MADAKPPTFARSVLSPAILAGLVLGLLGLFFSMFLGDYATLIFGLGGAFIAFVAGRALGHADRPRGRGLFVRHILTGVAFGFVGLALLQGIFREGPGWPWTPWFVLCGGFGWGIFRSHRALLKQARDTDASFGRVLSATPVADSDAAAKRWLGIFHPKDVEALSVLVLGWGLVGVMGFLVFRAFSGLIPGAGRALAIGIAIYALQGARYLLAFASEERGERGGWIAWLKAHALQNAIVVLILVAYAAFRDQLAGTMPFYPLIEFGLGIAIFGFVLARLRSRMKRDGALLATASNARDHERTVTELREPDYDDVARPVTRFLETGTGQAEYADALLRALPSEDPRAATIRARVGEHREPPRAPAIPMEWGYAAGASMTLGLAIAAFALAAGVFHAEMPFPVELALLFVGFGTYAQQDVARAHFRPWTALAIAAGGTAILFFDFLLFAGTVGSIAEIPGAAWGVVGGIVALMVGIPAFSSWRLDKRLRAGHFVDARRIAPALEVQTELQRTRKRAATMMLAAFSILLPVPWLVDWLAGRHVVPSEFPPFLDHVLGVAIWVIAAFGASALVRFYGLTRGRPLVLARERSKRERRLTIHKELMRTLDRS